VKGAFTKIPIIDVAPLLDPRAARENRNTIARQIGRACENVGFFYVCNHGLTEQQRVEVFAAAKEFFALPLEQKMKLHVVNSRQYRGYVPLLGETTGKKRDWHESLDIQPVFRGESRQEGEMLADAVEGHPLDDLGQWPEGIPFFREVLMRTWDQLFHLSEKITEGIAMSLGLEADYFKPYTSYACCDLRLAHYPPYEPREDVDVDAGMGAHVDNGILTVLPQDEAGGLEVRNAVGTWIPALHIPETLLVNIGMMVQRWTNDRFRATWHRVLLPKGNSRYSFPFFYEVPYDVVVEPLAVCCSEQNPPRYGPLHVGTHAKSVLSKAYA